MTLSISKVLRGSILLTGGVGFLGSVCLEQLLSLTEVGAAAAAAVAIGFRP
jgi:thioester reductase-like protein